MLDDSVETSPVRIVWQLYVIIPYIKNLPALKTTAEFTRAYISINITDYVNYEW